MGIDVGGTFTDIVLQFQNGLIVQAKAPSTPGNESKGVMDAIAATAAQRNTSVTEVLSRTRVINFGTTVARCAPPLPGAPRCAIATVETSSLQVIQELP